MQTPSELTRFLGLIKVRHNFTTQQLADYVGVSRYTVHRIQKNKIGDRVSTKLVEAILREYPFLDQTA